MGRIETSVLIDATTDAVYACVTDLEGAAERISGIESLEVLTDGEFGPGTRFRETRVMFGKQATEEMTITEVDPGAGYKTEAFNCGCRYESHVTVQSDGAGSRLTMGFQATPLSFMAKVMTVIMTPLMAGAARKAMHKDLEDIKSHLESTD